MQNIYLIDDILVRHKQITCLVSDLNTPGTEPAYVSDMCPPRLNDQVDEHEYDEDVVGPYIAESLAARSIWNKVSKAPRDSFFFVDIDLGKYEEKGKTRVDLNTLFEACIAEEPPDWGQNAIKLLEDGDAHSVFKEHGISIFVLAVLKARQINTYIISNNIGTGRFKKLAESWELDFSRYAGVEGEEWTDWRNWIRRFDRHKDSIIRNILSQYGAPVTVTEKNTEATRNEKVYWDHDFCDLDDQLENGRRIWSSRSSIQGLSTENNKALHSVDKNWKISQSPVRGITRAALEAALEKLDLLDNQCNPIFDFNGEQFFLPVEPGILFLLSLRELVVALESPKPVEMVFAMTEKSLCSVQIKLSKPRHDFEKMMLDLPKKAWRDYETFQESDFEETPGSKKKPKPIIEHIVDTGFWGSIFHLGHCRLRHVQGNEDWIRMFRLGSKRWTAWPCISDEGATFYWKGLS